MPRRCNFARVLPWRRHRCGQRPPGSRHPARQLAQGTPQGGLDFEVRQALEDAQRDWSALGQEKLFIVPQSRFRQGTDQAHSGNPVYDLRDAAILRTRRQSTYMHHLSSSVQRIFGPLLKYAWQASLVERLRCQGVIFNLAIHCVLELVSREGGPRRRSMW